MKHIKKLLYLLFIAPFFLSCSENDSLLGQLDILQSSRGPELVKSVTASVADFEFEDEDAATRLSHDYSSSTGYTFSWQLGDTLGIFPVENNQVEFPVKDGIGTSNALFSGGAWALRANYHYAAYYPFSSANYHRKITELPVDYSNQTMDGNEPLAHLGKYDFIVSAPQETEDNGSVNLNLQHLGCFVRFVINVPTPGTYKALTLSCDEAQFTNTATYDLSVATPALTPKQRLVTYRINLNNVRTTSDYEEIVVYAMLGPVNQLGKKVKVSLINNIDDEFSFYVDGKNMQAGHAYKFMGPSAQIKIGTFNETIKSIAKGSSATMHDFDNLIKEIKFEYNSSRTSRTDISAADSPYPIFVSYSGGRITVSTPAPKISCKNMSFLFYRCQSLKNVDLSGFDTQETFSLDGLFSGCSALTSVNISMFNTQNVSDMSGMFKDCASLSSLDLSKFDTQNVVSMDDMFYGCTSLTSLDLSSFDTKKVSQMRNMFRGCENLTNLNISSFRTPALKYMNLMFYGCSSLTSLDLRRFNTNNVLDMNNLFENCTSLSSLNISNFNTSVNVRNMNSMFKNCYNITSLVLGYDFLCISPESKMFVGFASLSKNCIITCPEDTKESIQSDETLPESYISWDIID